MGPCPGVRARPSARAKTTDRRGVRPLRTANLGQPQAVAHGRPTSAPTNPPRGAWLGLGRRCVTPRQTCPRPKGFGRNLRSKTRWFTGFCNFATFFIDARAEISVAESHFRLFDVKGRRLLAPFSGLGRRSSGCVSLARLAPGFGLLFRGEEGPRPPAVPSHSSNRFAGRSVGQRFRQ